MIERIRRKIAKVFNPKIGEILMFHRVLVERSPIEDELNYAIEVTPECLEQTIIQYQQAGYKFATLDDYYREITLKKLFRLPKKMVCFTFDDGFVDNYEIAYPIFKKYACPFTIYVTSGFVNKTAKVWWCREDEPGEKKLALTVEQLQELAQDGLCTIGVHTVSHPHLAELTYEEQYREIAESKKYLEQVIGQKVEHMSYPHGSYNDDSVKIAEVCGFKTATRNFGDTVRCKDGLFTLNRRYIKEE